MTLVTDHAHGHPGGDLSGVGGEPSGADRHRRGLAGRESIWVGLVGQGDQAAVGHRDIRQFGLAAAHQFPVPARGVW